MRVTSEFFIQALIRRAFRSGGFAAVVRRGAAEAGAIFIVQRDRLGRETLYGPAPQAGYAEERPAERRFVLLIAEAEAEAVAARLAREARFDSDLWTVEVEDGETPLAELIEVITP